MTELLAPPVEGNELEDFADEYVSSQFTDLYKTDLFMLDWLETNPNAWYEFLSVLAERWGNPPDEEQQIVKQEIQIYAPTEG